MRPGGRFVIQYAIMTTHRSLNKLEFKAHMSIHNVAEVPSEGAAGEVCATRDRFGRKHEIRPEAPRRRKGPAAAVILLAGVFMASAARADEGFVPADAPTSPAKARGTNVTVVSEGRRPLWAEDTPRDPDFAIPIDDRMSLDINDDGDPNVNYRF